MRYDVIIIGAGVAGLYAALNLPKSKKVLIINKRETFKCNSFYAQGGVALARDERDIPLHIDDTLQAGDGLCCENAVDIMSKNSREIIDDIIYRGFEFDSDESGNLLYTKEAAHSCERILHAGGDATGRYLHHFLLDLLLLGLVLIATLDVNVLLVHLRSIFDLEKNNYCLIKLVISQSI